MAPIKLGFGAVAWRCLMLALALSLTACESSDNGDSDEVGPVAGISEGYADFPVGVPLGGYTARCRCFGNQGRYDARRTAYHHAFNPSIGVQTQPKIVALWLESAGQDLVLIKTDAIYTFEGFVNALEQRLSAATGRDLAGKVVIASNHSHSAPANWDQGLTWYLGGDRFNREVFERGVASMADIALEAWNRREPAAIGVGQAVNWDPNDRVYRDRRGDNDDIQFFDDIPAGRYKDPYLTVLRVDTAAGEPMGMFFAFAIHGTVAGEDNQLWSVEASGHVEAAVEEKFDSPVVVGFMQHGGGDASPAGVDDLFARMESIGELAADAIYNLWQQTPTSTAPITLESVSRTVDTRRDMISVEREHGTLTYAPFSPSPEFEPDNIVYDDQGRIITPIDEFNTANGGAFCGAASPPLPVASIGADVFPYASCLEVGTVADFIGAFFMVTDIEKPLPESLQAKTGASRIGPLSILTPSGEVVQDDVLMAFFPGEATATYTEQFRRRAASELGMDHTIPVGYAQDHQGYLLIPEDWLQGGYEPNINLWGPLHAEHIMEGVLSAAGEVLLTEAVEPYDPAANLSPVYAEVALPTVAPDLTPNAGTALSELPSYFLIPVEGLSAASAPPSSVRRVQDVVQFMWEGGDPGVDLPVVYLEVQADDGSWDRVLTASGRPVSSPMHDMLLATTPNPLAPATAEQRHVWWVAWQAVPHFYDRAGLPLGSYRFHIEGQRYTGGAQTWPWPSEPYQLDSPTFEVVPAEITLAIEGEKLIGSIDAPATGFRLIDVEGSSRGSNPVRNATITISFPDGSSQQVTPEASIVNRRSEWTLGANALVGASAVEVVDGYGNRGNLQID